MSLALEEPKREPASTLVGRDGDKVTLSLRFADGTEISMAFERDQAQRLCLAVHAVIADIDVPKDASAVVLQ